MVVGTTHNKTTGAEAPLPCELLPDSRILNKIDFDQRMTAVCVEVKDVEAPKQCLIHCQQHAYFLLQLIFRFGRILHDKNKPYLMACSVVEPCILVEKSIRGSISFGRLFWLFFPVDCTNWFRNVVKDIAMINNGYHGLNDVFATDFDFDAVGINETDFISDDDAVGDSGGSNNILEYNIFGGEDDDQRSSRQRRRKNKRESRSLTASFKAFNLVRGMGPENLKRKQIKSTDSITGKVSLRRLEDLDRHLELYFTYMFLDWNEKGHSRLPSFIRENDTQEAWEERLRLLSPNYLFRSHRRSWQKREIAHLARSLNISDVPDKIDEVFLERVLDVKKWPITEGDRVLVEYVHQLLPNRILQDNNYTIDLTHFVAWKLERYMLEPLYFVDHLFPSLEKNVTMRPLLAEIRGVPSNEINEDTVDGLDDLGNLYVQRNTSSDASESRKTQYELKNPAICQLKKVLDKMGRNTETYVDKERCRAFFVLYEEAHRRGNLQMSRVLKTSYRDAENWFESKNSFTNKCLNAAVSETTRHCIPFVYSFLKQIHLGYQTLFGFLRIICNVTGANHTLSELTFVLLSGINQLKPHRSMSLHSILLGPPGGGKSRMLNVAKAIMGSKYVIMVTYRTAKSNLVACAGEKYDSSKKMRFMGEFVPSSGSEKNNPLASESSAESTALKEELDTGITRSERVEKVMDANTGRVSHRTVLEDCICDNANVFAMNEMDFCRSLDSRFVTHQVPVPILVPPPKRHDDFGEKLDRYKIHQFYGALRHLVMETSRLNEIGLFPSRLPEEDPTDFRSYVLTWDRLSNICQEMGVIYGLKHNIRIRERCFAIGKLMSEIFAVFTVYGCPPRPVWENIGEKRPNESQVAYNDRLILAHAEWLGKQSRKHLHDEVVAESALDPADLLFAFSVVFQFIQKERCVLNGLVAHVIDPQNTCKLLTDDNVWYFVLPNKDSTCISLEQKSRLSAKSIADTLKELEGMKKDGHSVLRQVKDVNEFSFEISSSETTPANAYLIYAPFAADIFAAEYESRVWEIARQVQNHMGINIDANSTTTTMRRSTDIDYKSCYVKLFVDEKYQRDLYFLQHLQMKESHVLQSQQVMSVNKYFLEAPKFHAPADPLTENGKYEITVHRDFFESRSIVLRNIFVKALMNKTAFIHDDGYVEIRFESKRDRFQFECLIDRSVDGNVLSNQTDEPIRITNTLLFRTQNENSSLVTVSLVIFHPSLNGHGCVEQVRSEIWNNWNNEQFENNVISVPSRSDINESSVRINDDTYAEWMRLKKKSCVRRCLNENVLFVNIMLLNRIRPLKTVNSRHSVMRSIMERTVFCNMTERRSIVYVDKSDGVDFKQKGESSRNDNNPFCSFSVLDVEKMREKNQLENYLCKNPYKDQNVRNATTDSIDGVRFRDDEYETEPNALTLCEDHVSKRKALLRVIASGAEHKLVKDLAHESDIQSKRQRYARGMKRLIEEEIQRYDNYYIPIKCYQTLGTFPEYLTDDGANRWEPYVDDNHAAPSIVGQKRQCENVENDHGISVIKKKSIHNLARLKSSI